MLAPNQTFHFQKGQKLEVVAEVAAGMAVYDGVHSAWPELVVTAGDALPTRRQSGTVYGYEHFPNQFTLGCRLESLGNIICSLMDNTDRDDLDGGRIWEMSFFQKVGTFVFGGGAFRNAGTAFHRCEEHQPDTECRDVFRWVITPTSITMFVNGVRYFEQSGIPTLPTELTDGPVTVWFASINSGLDSPAVRFHWDSIEVNPGAEE